MGYSRDRFYRFKELYEKGGEPCARSADASPAQESGRTSHIEKVEVEIGLEKPAFGQVRVANELTKRGLFVSLTGVRCVWLRTIWKSSANDSKTLEASAQERKNFMPLVSQKAVHPVWRTCRPTWDDCLAAYNRTRPHSGKYCYGKTRDADLLAFGFSGAGEDARRKIFLRPGAGAVPRAA